MKQARPNDRTSKLKTLHLKVVSVPEPLEARDLRMSHSPGSVTSISSFRAFTTDNSSELDRLYEFLAYHRAFRVFWVNRSDETSLSDLHNVGVDLTKLTFTTAANAFLSLKNCLQSARHPLLIVPKNELSRDQMRELEPLLVAAQAELILLT